MSACAITCGHFASPARSRCSNPSIEASRGFRKLSKNGLRGVLAAADAIRNPHPAIGGAGQHKPRQTRDPAFDLTDSIEMSHLVLRHRIWPPLNSDDTGYRRHPEQRPVDVAYRLHDLLLRKRHQLVLQHPADESTHKN